MPVSRKTRNQKNNSFGLRKKEKAKKELMEWQERNMANRDYNPYSTYLEALAIRAFRTKNQKG